MTGRPCPARRGLPSRTAEPPRPSRPGHGEGHGDWHRHRRPPPRVHPRHQNDADRGHWLHMAGHVEPRKRVPPPNGVLDHRAVLHRFPRPPRSRLASLNRNGFEEALLRRAFSFATYQRSRGPLGSLLHRERFNVKPDELLDSAITSLTCGIQPFTLTTDRKCA